MAPVLVEYSSHPSFISNTYLVADGAGGPAFFIDAGGPVAPLIDAAERLALTPTHVLLTHHHFDHISDVAALRERWPDLRVLISERERELLHDALAAAGADGSADAAFTALGPLEADRALRFGALEVRPLHTPGHTAGMLSLLVRERAQHDGASGEQHARATSGAHAAGQDASAAAHAAVFTGDTLFKDSVGGVKAPGHTTYADLRHSIMHTLMQLPPDTVVYPGHAEHSTVAREWQSNPFIRVWRGLDPEGSQPCTALGQPATLVLLAGDYDGGTKAWVRWQDGTDDIVPGSRIDSR
jgi:hydroxyacylglutathione hydrolase